MISNKILSKHLNRRAIVYLRQSTVRQVVEHTESTVRQYALAERAEALGWEKDSIEVIDEDLGLSGALTETRTGFRRLAEKVGKGEIGALFALEVSRFARCSADWHQLLDLCGWGDVLIIDEQGIFDPKEPNDRLLLGLKGQMSEAEKYWMRLRMHGAKLSLARRGELPLFPPVGYVWDSVAKSLVMNPDERVQATIRLVFERFRIEGTMHGVQKWLIRERLRLPVRHRGDPEVLWVRPRPRTLLDLMHNPIYTGTYVYGRHESRTTMSGTGRRISIVSLPRDQWKVFLPDRHPAYLSWEEYMKNQEKLTANRATFATPGSHRAALDGAALLQGIVLCGRCGTRMGVKYTGECQRPLYLCDNPRRAGESMALCWSVAGTPIDEQVATAFLEASQPGELELALAVTNEAAHQADQVDEQWRLRIERTRFEARHAERRYMAVDPDNRVVARTLEAQWEEKLRELEEAEKGYQEAKSRKKVVLNEDDRQRILALARDLPSVWRASSTTNQQRKNLLRILIREVTLTPIDVPSRSTRIQILWESGAVTEATIPRARIVPGIKADEETEDLVRRLVQEGRYDREIVEILNSDPVAAEKRTWNQEAVARLRYRLGVSRPYATPAHDPAPERRGDGLWSSRGLAERFGVKRRTVSQWAKNGLIQVVDGGGHGRPAWFELDEAGVERIEAHLRRSPRSSGGAS